MWRNIFIESCILSLLVFGGFYINANFLKAKITESGERIRKQADESQPRIHLSGTGYEIPLTRDKVPHISGSRTPTLPPTSRKQPIGIGSPDNR